MDTNAKTDSIILGGGCFWCTESVFLAVPGVLDVMPGYCGGHVDNPSYEQVCSENTGHVEVVRVTYDPGIIGLEALLQIFFATHDPTTLNRQGGDAGPQYASVVFYENEQQKAVARQVTAEVQELLGRAVVTRIEEAGHFWPAEDYHRNYYAKHPSQGYCQMVISPKMAKFRHQFASLLQG
ncbi:peptide-methionine (S)-S-oxide reductase MsrA [Eoetvoesiella caeni]|uniref:Peptide methionine sulfoxide reductase MsrA n=1 Tax=Eoetvoesiella caeni TaxID=645616 RepID=A0A366HBX1_9BURK|nr:peptide-methionine (S)-S-oxide reductase MsrA [Eoetvoesiella caeni]MCI2809142.1 peptide-methionine (S)-S-oxide reductase MsrA [Eoetvoesiella caeni]NYT55357.1 peptide-methionine (S)-S-oxide reductase MsrA [Eoetvoesiella caeni]RBP39908.1 peptide-methionine (S)-S-oxide reductase [Eoetvoesiella caeni]